MDWISILAHGSLFNHLSPILTLTGNWLKLFCCTTRSWTVTEQMVFRAHTIHFDMMLAIKC